MPGVSGGNGQPPAGFGLPIYGQSATFGSPPSPGSSTSTWKKILIGVGAAVAFLIIVFVAIPTFLGASRTTVNIPLVTNNSHEMDLAAQLNLTDALESTVEIYANNHWTFNGLTIASLQQASAASAPSMTWVGPTTPAPNKWTVSVAVVDHAILLTDRSDDGQCWYELRVYSPTPEESPQLPQLPGQYYASNRGAVCEAAHWPAQWSRGGFLPA